MDTGFYSIKMVITAFCVAILTTGTVFADNISDYKEYAEEVRESIWNSSPETFISPAKVSERFSDEPAVVLASHRDISAKKKTGIGFNRASSLIPIKKVALINMDDYERKLYLINDKSALEELSEYDLPVKEGSGDWFYQTKDERKYVLGVRIIKQDGRIIDVPTDDFVITSMENNDKKAKRQKLAVPGLEVGDKLDIFLFTHTALKNIQPETIFIHMRDRYPVMSHTVRCKIDDDLTTIYRNRNGAPELAVEQGPDKDFILTGAALEPIDGCPEYMYVPSLQSPYIEMQIYNRRFDEYTPAFARKDGVQANPDAQKTVIDDRIAAIEHFADQKQAVALQLRSIKGNPAKSVKNKLKNGEWTQSQAAEYLYNLLTFSYMTGKYKFYPRNFVIEFDKALENAGIKNTRRAISVPRGDGPLDSTINYKDIWYMLYLPDTGQYFSYPFNDYNTSSEIIADLQGEKGIYAHSYALKKKERLAEDRNFTIPQSDAKDNRLVNLIHASYDDGAVKIHRKVSATGAAKRQLGKFLTADNLLQGYLEYLNYDGIQADPQILRKEKAKDKAQRMERNSDEEQEQLNEIRKETAGYHGVDAVDLTDFVVTAVGIGHTPEQAAVVFDMDYSIDGIAKSAGRNLMIGIGQLLQRHAEYRLSQRNRLQGDDVLIRYPEEDITEITFDIPDGYQVSEATLSKLDMEVSNTAGHFKSDAGVENGKLTVRISHLLDFKRLPASSWKDVVDIRDAAANFNTASVLLERK